MNLLIETVRAASSGEWDSAWRACRYATFFQSREWADIWRGYSHGEIYPDPRIIRFSDGVELLFPLSVQRLYGGMLERYLSSPAGTFGGWLSSATLSDRHAQLVLKCLKSRKHGLTWQLNPYDQATSTIQLPWTANDVTHTLDLRSGFDVIYGRISKGHRSAAKKAARSGVTIGVARTEDEWHQYYKVYQDNLRKWGSRATSRYSRELFDVMVRQNSPYIRLWLAFYAGEVIAGALCFYAATHVVYWHGASLERHLALRAPNLLIEAAIRQACECGHEWFDFNPSGGHQGAKEFKEHFGTRELACPRVVLESFSLKLAKARAIHDAVRSLRRLARRVRGEAPAEADWEPARGIRSENVPTKETG